MSLSTLQVLRQEVQRLQEQYRQYMLSMSASRVRLDEEKSGCGVCGQRRAVQKTVRRKGVTLAAGAFELQRTVRVCPAGCPERGDGLNDLLPRGCVVGYDVMAYIGRQRFLEHRQREEIRRQLMGEYGIRLSAAEISMQGQRFLQYLERLHEQAAPRLRRVMESDGGWPMHCDATGEDGQGTLLVVLAGWRQWVLGAWKIPTERSETILPHLQETVQCFGMPVAIMRDLGAAMSDATQLLVQQQQSTAPVLACHQHFLSDIGKDLLSCGHDGLRELFRTTGLRSQVRRLARDLGRLLGPEIHSARLHMRGWLDQPPDALLPGKAGLATIRSLAQWMLDYPADLTDEGFPYDLPWLAFYDRCLQIVYTLKAFSEPKDTAVAKSLLRLQRILRPILADKPGFAILAETLTMRFRLFRELRQALRLFPKSLSGETWDARQLQDVQAKVEKLQHSLAIRQSQPRCTKDKAQAIQVILNHLKKHASFLWGHVIPTPGAARPCRLVDRTNNREESFFHTLKHNERRRSGRKCLTQDFEHLPAAVALAYNLNHPDYVSALCGSLDRLPAAFARLDNQMGNSIHHHTASQTGEFASLSRADRLEVRAPGFTSLIVAAAQRGFRAEAAQG